MSTEDVRWTDQDYFGYLDTLRDRGVTYMFGATPYLQEEFGLEAGEAKLVLSRWFKSYEEEEKG